MYFPVNCLCRGYILPFITTNLDYSLMVQHFPLQVLQLGFHIVAFLSHFINLWLTHHLLGECFIIIF